MSPSCLSRVPPLIEAASAVAKASKWTQKAQEQCIFISLLHTPENRLIADPPLESLISENAQLLHGSGNCLMKEEGMLLGSSSVLTVSLNLEQNHKWWKCWQFEPRHKGKTVIREKGLRENKAVVNVFSEGKFAVIERSDLWNQSSFMPADCMRLVSYVKSKGNFYKSQTTVS